MRGCLVFLLALVVAGALALWYVLPAAAGMLTAGALRASGLDGTDVTVDVRADPPLLLLVGHADSVHVRGSDASLGDLHAAQLDVTLRDVSLFSRQFKTVSASLTGVTIATPGGDPATARTVTIDGDAAAASAVLTLSTAEAVRLAAGRIASEAGLTAAVTFEAPSRVRVSAIGLSATGTISVSAGALVLRLDDARLPTVTLVAPQPGNPFVLESVAVDSAGVRLGGTIDVAALVAATNAAPAAASAPISIWRPGPA